MALDPVDDGLWIAEGPLVDFHGFPYPTRTAVARLPAGGLWVWSPVRLSAELKRCVDRLGPVTHLVSPNKLHHLSLAEWHGAYPAAKLWATASTIEKRSDLTFEPPLRDEPPVEWQGTFSQAWFRGSPLVDEVAFVHKPSSTALLADLSENFSPAFLAANWKPWQRWVAHAAGIVEGQGKTPLDWRLSWLNHAPGRAAREKLLAADPERVIMAHGQWIRQGGRDFLARVLAWL